MVVLWAMAREDTLVVLQVAVVDRAVALKGGAARMVAVEEVWGEEDALGVVREVAAQVEEEALGANVLGLRVGMARAAGGAGGRVVACRCREHRNILLGRVEVFAHDRHRSRLAGRACNVCYQACLGNVPQDN